MTRYDNLVSAGAWDDLVEKYNDSGAEDADDHELAEILRLKMIEVEG